MQYIYIYIYIYTYKRSGSRSDHSGMSISKLRISGLLQGYSEPAAVDCQPNFAVNAILTPVLLDKLG